MWFLNIWRVVEKCLELFSDVEKLENLKLLKIILKYNTHTTPVITYKQIYRKRTGGLKKQQAYAVHIQMFTTKLYSVFLTICVKLSNIYFEIE